MRSKPKIPTKYDFMRDENNNLDYYSYSRLNIKCPYEFYLSKIKGIKSEDNIYTAMGSLVHDILEKFYNNEMDREQMIEEFQLHFILLLKTYIFKADMDKNQKMSENYYESILSFLKEHKKIVGKTIIEMLLFINIKNKHLLIGYVDLISRMDKNLVITDWKTSSIYNKRKQEEYAEQLLLYALGLSQNLNINLNQIKIRWNFIRYVKVKYPLNNGNYKEAIYERCSFVEDFSNQLKRILKHNGYDSIETCLLINECIEKNSLESLNFNIKKQIHISEAYVYYDFNREQIQDTINNVEVKIEKIINRGYEEKSWFREEKITNKDAFYCNTLCGVKKHCFYYTDYINEQNFYTNK